MTTYEAMEKLRTYDELEGKYYAALARIDEYERERAEIRERAVQAAIDVKKLGAMHGGLNNIINTLKPPETEDDEIKVGDEVINNYDTKGIVVTLGEICLEGLTITDERGAVCFEWFKSECRKTGKHYPQIAEMMKELGG